MIYLLITLIVVFIFQGLEDENRRKASTMSKYKYTIKWHNIALLKNFILWGFVSASLLGISWKSLLLLFTIGLTRLVVLNTTINLYRGKNNIWYFSKSSSYPDKLLYKFPKVSYFTTLTLFIINWIILIK